MPNRSRGKIVLDAWPILALIFKEEPAASQVADLLDGGVSDRRDVHMSWINLGEVYYRVAVRKKTDAADAFLADFLLLPVTIHEPAKTDILSAAKMKSSYRMSYADTFAAALAQKRDAVIWTGDPELVALEKIS